MNPFTKGKTGSRASNATLSENDVRAIRRLEGQLPARDVSDIYSCGPETVRKIWRRDSWRWVTDVIDFELPAQTVSSADQLAADESAARVLAAVSGAPAPVSGLDKLAQTAAVVAEKKDKVDNALVELDSFESRAKAYGAGEKR